MCWLYVQACYRDQLWNSLLSLASSWCSVREAPVTAAASALYVTLFVVFDAALERQQVLHALHGHLGSGVSGQQNAALQVRGRVSAAANKRASAAALHIHQHN